MNTIPHNWDHTVDFTITIRNLNIMNNCLVKRNVKSHFWLEQYHTTIDKRNTGYTEVVDKVPANETMLYYFIYVISSHQHTFQMSGYTQISVHTNIIPSVGTIDM